MALQIVKIAINEEEHTGSEVRSVFLQASSELKYLIFSISPYPFIR